MEANEISWIFFAILSSLMAALSTIFAKIGLQKIDPLTSTALRSIIITVFTLSVTLYITRNINLIKSLAKNEVIFIILSGIAGGLSWIFYFMALQKGYTTVVAAIDKSSIIFVLLFSILFLKESLTINKILAIILITIGLFLLIF